MSTASKIEWTETTWNPVTGCDRISSGCDRCYALTLAKRLKAMGSRSTRPTATPARSGPGFAVTVHQDTVLEPLRWRKPRVVFVNSMSDLFHARVPDAFIAPVFAVMAATPQHTYQVLTKRPRRMRALLGLGRVLAPRPVPPRAPWAWGRRPAGPRCRGRTERLGRHVDRDDDYTWRADSLRQVPAAVRFLSLEPLLGPLPSLSLHGIHWVIAGGESGPGCTGHWTWPGSATSGTAAPARTPRSSSSRSAGQRRRPADASWTAAPGTSTRAAGQRARAATP